MSFVELQKAIYAEAKKQTDASRERFRAQAAKEEERIQREARALEEHILSAAEAEGKQRAQRIHQTAQLAGRSKILHAKQHELTETQAAVVDEILSWDTDRATKLVAALFDLVPKEDGTVVPGSQHAKLVRAAASRRDLVCADEEIPQDGGFIFRSPKAELNVTVSRLVADLFARHRAELARTLFDNS